MYDERERNIHLSLKEKPLQTNESVRMRWPAFIVTTKRYGPPVSFSPWVEWFSSCS